MVTKQLTLFNLKTCNSCSISKPLSAFHKNRASPDGYQYKCKNCVREYQKSRTFTPSKIGQKFCPHCKEQKSVAEFYIDKRKPSGRSSWCALCLVGGERTREQGYVYFISGADKVKIGFATKSPIERLKSHQVGSPVLLTLLGYIKDDKAQQLETRLKRQFAIYISHGEWYFHTSQIDEYITLNAQNNQEITRN